MKDVDAILRSGEYTDRRGSRWGHVRTAGLWVLWADPSRVRLTPAQMKRLIVRDLHRAECPGLDSCGAHPVATVAKGARGGWATFPPRCDVGRVRPTFAEAIAAAHNTTGDTQ